MRNLVAAILSLTAIAGAGLAQAAPGDVTIAVLGIEPTEAPESLAVELTEAIRGRLQGYKGYELVPGKDLVEVKLVFSCADESPPCMAQAAKSLGAHKMLFGTVKKSVKDNFVVSLKLIDAQKGSVESWIAEQLPQKQANAAGIRAVLPKWFGTIFGEPATGSVRVRSTVAGAAVVVDGSPVGTTGPEDVIAELTPGKHDILVQKPGHHPARQEVTIVAGESLSIDVPLATAEAAPPPPPIVRQETSVKKAHIDPKPSSAAEARSGLRTGFWVTLGVGVLSAGVAVKYGLDVVDVNSQLDQYRRYDCKDGSGRTCDETGKTKLEDPNNSEVQRLKDEGQHAETIQWVFIGLGSAFAVASAYLLYRGYLDPGSSETEFAGGRGVRIFPTAGSGSGGVLMEFDF